MDNQSAFQRGIGPTLEILLRGKEEALLSLPPDEALNERVEVLAGKCNEGELTDEERAEYTGYVQADHFLAVLHGMARARRAGAAS